LFNRGGSAGAADKPAQPKSQTKAAKAAGEGGNFFSSLTSRLPFFGGDADSKKSAAKATSKTRASKVPQAAGEGMSLDTKLDILGVGLVFGAMLLLLSALSPQPGALTGQINAAISRVLGWGAIAVPLIMLAIGVWLILRHFGDEAPQIDPMRLIGVGLAYIALLITFQYAYSFDPIFQGNFDLYRQLSSKVIELGRGGGSVGWSLYELLVTNATEIGGMVITLGLFVISLMLVTRTSAAELAVIVTSVVRSFQVSVQRRAQARAAARLEAEKATPLQPQTQISVARPAPAELPPAPVPAALPVAANALPEPETMEMPIEERLTIRAGGQTLSNTEAVPIPAVPAASAAGSGVGTRPVTDGDGASRSRGLSVPLPGFFSRGKSESDGDTPAITQPEKQDEGGILGRFGRRSSVSGTGDAPGVGNPAAASAASGMTSSSGSSSNPQPSTAPRTINPFSRPAPSQPVSQPAAASAAPGTAVSPTSGGPNRPAGQSQELPPDFFKPATPKGILQSQPDSGTGISADGTTPSGIPLAATPTNNPASTGVLEPADASTAQPAAPAAQPSTTEIPAASTAGTASAPASPYESRSERLNQLRSGYTARPDSAATSGAPAPVSTTPAPSAPANGDGERPSGGGPLRPRPFTSTPSSAPTSPSTVPPTENAPAASSPTVPSTDGQTVSPAVSPTSQPAQPVQPAAAQSPVSQPAAQPNAIPSTASAGMPPMSRTSTSGPAVASNAEINLPQAPTITSSTPKSRRTYNVPDYRSLLAPGSEQDFDREALVKRAKIIEETLSSFGAPGRVVEINTGPVITQFGVEPDYVTVRGGKKSRVKVSAIAQLDKDLQLSLGAKSVRIEAPVPGKGFVGIEVPNDQPATVSLRDVMESKEFNRIKSPLAIALGQSVDGAPVAADLTSMPHLLIAGTTGSGKSVCVNAIIASLILRNTPDKLKFIMVDPKRVELTGYNGVPHLVAPVVVELERIVGVLKWVTREMDERYKRFSNAGARNIEDYNKHLREGEELMPYIVVIIDELADLMMLAPEETERTITRIAALARATGIHLVIATQRPSVDVVTGLIKANFPARVAFAVASGIDSRVILDQPGAERLLGRGDMLYMSGDAPAPLRMQGVFVSDTEINNMVRYWRSQASEDGMPIQRSSLSMAMEDEESARSAVPTRSYGTMQVTPGGSSSPRAASYTAPQAYWDDDGDDDDAPLRPSSGGAGGDSDEDELYDEAVEMVRRLGKASVSLLQRRLRIGYTRAARLIDVMEERGIVGPATEGSKPREVLK
jgi:DNA segregation ATPase FtsK/SpoIIIE, S-DNA-T family